MTDRRVFWAIAAMTVLAAFVLAGCTGGLPLPEPVDVAEAAGSELEFTAPVDGMGPDVWSIGGLAVAIHAETEVAGDPKVGDLVRVQALLSPDGLSARQIEVVGAAAQALPAAVAAPGDDEVEFVGPVASIGADVWVIGDRAVSVTSQTEIQGAIVVGDMAKVHASLNDDLSLTAREIEPARPGGLTEAEVDDDSDDAEELEFKGIVESIDGETWTVGGMAFRVLPETELLGTIAVGDFVEIHAVWSPDGILTAVRIAPEDDAASEVDDDPDDDLDDQDDGEDDDEDEDDHDDEVEDEDDSDDDSGSGSGGD